MRILSVIFLIICFSLSFTGIYINVNNTKNNTQYLDEKEEDCAQKSNNLLEEEVKHIIESTLLEFSGNYSIDKQNHNSVFIKNSYHFIFISLLDNPPENVI
jgi:hypothetical protein